MVENNEQWEDTEYSDDMGEEQEYSSDYDDEYSGQSEEEYEEDYDEGYTQPAKKGNPLPILILFIVLVGVIIAVLMMKLGSGSNQGAENIQADNGQNFENSMPVDNNQQPQQSTNDLANSFFSDAGGENNNPENQDNNMMSVNFNDAGQTNVVTGNGDSPNEQVATVSDTDIQNTAKESDLFDTQTNPESSNRQENNAIMVSYNKGTANTNPFKPPVIVEKKPTDIPFELINNTQFEIIEPPKESIVDENLTRLLKTQISGILYDSVSPSAIVNLNGLDHFVKVGDTISGYTIKSITKDKVQITYKNNSYVASVGELFSPGDLTKQQSVANLQNKFAGRYKN